MRENKIREAKEFKLDYAVGRVGLAAVGRHECVHGRIVQSVPK